MDKTVTQINFNPIIVTTMKKIFAIALSFAAISLTGCIQDKIVDRQPVAGGEVRVTSTIDGNSTRASIDNFTTGNAIGIYKLPAGAADFSTAHRENAQYTYAGEGNFAPFDETHKLFWKETAVDFVAYYPYEALTAGDFTYDIDVTEQTDFLYSDKVTNKTEGTVNFLFHHKLSKIKFEVTSEDTDIDLEGMTVVIKGMNTLAEFDLEASELEILEDSADDIIATIDGVTGTTATAHALVLPASGYPTFDVEITLANGDTDTETFTNKNFVADKQHTYELNLTIVDEQLEIGVGGSTIDPWEDGDTSDDVTTEEPEPVINEGDITSTLPAGDDVTAEGGNFSISYVITNPIDGEVVDPVITGDFITIAPETRATQAGTVNFIVAENTTTEPRTGSIALNYNEVTLKTITITQAAGEAEETINWLFDGADFNGGSLPANVSASKATPTYGATAGIDGSGALVINGTASKNDEAFRINVPSEPAPAITSSVSFFIKGVAQKKSFAIRTSLNASSYFSLGDCSVDKTYTASGNADYGTGINTNDKWTKITLPITSAPEYIEFRWGNTGVYDIAIDNITFE